MQTDNRQKTISTLTLAILLVNIVATVCIAVYLLAPTGGQPGVNGGLSFDSTENGQYVIYIGTNDKDTYEQIIPTDEAKEIVNGICAKYVEGYTVSEAKGGWVDEKGVLTQENTLVYSFLYADEQDIVSIMDDVLKELNQNSILIERRSISSVFYNGMD